MFARQCSSRLRPAGLAAACVIAVAGLVAPTRAQTVPCETYTLDNGMTVILREDRTLPVATINLWYRVGAKEEPVGRSGFAHLFEHLMFMGTKRVPGSDFDNLMERGGGSNNASTSLDRTNYFSSGPRELLPTLLWLDADRMEDLGRMMNQEKLDKQRDVVRNERRQTTENTPYGKADDAMFRLLYPQGHPYYNAVIGTHQDIEAATVTDVKDFFATFYVPNNCSLVVAGDFESAQIKPLIAGMFGTLPRGGAVVNKTSSDVPMPVIGKVVRASMLDKVEQPRVTFAYHSPAWYSDGDAEMDLAGAVLTSGKSSRLYKRLVLDEKLATEVAAYQGSAVLSSIFQINVLTTPSADLTRVEQIVDEEITRMCESGIGSEELTQRQNTIELGFLSRMESLHVVADKLNEYQFIWGEPNSFKRDLDRYRSATPERVQAWAKKVLTPGSRVVMRVLPEEPQREAGPRDTNPALANAGTLTIPKPDEFTLSSGVRAMLWSKAELPLVTVRMVFPAPEGTTLVSADRAGLAHLTAAMLGEGAGNLDAVGFADAMQKLGATFNASASHTAITVDMTVLKRNLPKAVELFGDAIRTPRLTQADFERVQRLHMQALEAQLAEPAFVAARAAQRVLMGDAHPYSVPASGSPASVKARTLDEVAAMHRELITPSAARLLISGDVSSGEAQQVFERALSGAEWKPAAAAFKGAASAGAPAASSSDGPMRVYVIHRPEAVQTVIRFATFGPKVSQAERVPYRVLNVALGGSFTSRLNQNLREDKGYTYGARSGFTMEPTVGWWVAGASVKADVTGAALGEFMKEFARIRTGDLSVDEVQKAVKTLRTQAIQDLEGLSGPVTLATELMLAGQTLGTVSEDLAAAAKLDNTSLNAIAPAAIKPATGVLVLVGDKALILEQIKGMSLPTPVELGADGTKLSE